jgi:signal peptidase I
MVLIKTGAQITILPGDINEFKQGSCYNLREVTDHKKTHCGHGLSDPRKNKLKLN